MTRRTKRRYAHELYPHAEEWETRPLSVEVPYLYARAIGFQVEGTSWIDMPGDTQARRITEENQSARTAFIADALLQGLAGDEAWAWADSKLWGDPEWLYQRAAHYGVNPEGIKPYSCGPEPDHHDHYELVDGHDGWREVIRVNGRESDCPDCTEEVGDAS